ncbi:MAG: alginate lyase family protein [Anaerolineae bacterium]|nr:alginate lyase family protein [Anaerolineae bacterium]
MIQEPIIGPRLSDADFFSQIDTTRPGLQDIPERVSDGDFAAARRLFAAEVRDTLQPERFFSIRRAFRGYNFMYENESAEQAAERILRNELISCGTPHPFGKRVDWFANPTFNQYKEWTWQLSRHPEWGVLGERYRETGDERFAEAFVRFFTSWVQQALVPENASGGDTLCWRTIEAGIRMGGVWQWALHSFYRSSHFSDDVLIDWYKSVWEHGWRLRHFHRTGNWLIMEMNGLAQIGILYPQFLNAQTWKHYAFERLVDELDAQVYPDGFQVELSTGYHQVDILNYQWLIDVCQAYQEPIPEAFRTGMERMHTVNVMMMMPDGRLPDVNDGGWREVAPLLEDAVKAYPYRADFLWVYTHGQAGTPPDHLSHAFPYAGYMTMRNTWQPDALWALFDGGPFGYGHQHEDKLNLILHAYGKLLLTEGGNYAYDNSEMRRYVLSTRAHNTIRVDGQDQNRRLSYNRAEFDVAERAAFLWKTTDQYDVVEGMYDQGYGPEADHAITHLRKVIFLKQSAIGPCWIIVDRLLSKDQNEHTCQVLWHLNVDQTEITGTVVHGADPGQPNLSIIPSDPNVRLSVIRGQEKPEWQGWKTIKHHRQGEYAPAPAAVYEWTVREAARLVTLLYPTRPGDTCPIRTIAASPDIVDMAITLTLNDGSTVALSETDFTLEEAE